MASWEWVGLDPCRHPCFHIQRWDNTPTLYNTWGAEWGVGPDHFIQHIAWGGLGVAWGGWVCAFVLHIFGTSERNFGVMCFGFGVSGSGSFG